MAAEVLKERASYQRSSRIRVNTLAEPDMLRGAAQHLIPALLADWLTGASSEELINPVILTSLRAAVTTWHWGIGGTPRWPVGILPPTYRRVTDPARPCLTLRSAVGRLVSSVGWMDRRERILRERNARRPGSGDRCSLEISAARA